MVSLHLMTNAFTESPLPATGRRVPVWLRWTLAALLALALGVAWENGTLRDFADGDRLRALLATMGPWAYLLFVVTFAVIHPFGVPALLWVLTAAVLWPFWIAFSLSLAGAALGGSVAFLFARYLAREWVAARLPLRLRRYDERLEAHGLTAVIVIRLVLRVNPATPLMLGLSRVRYDKFLLGTVVGLVPSIAFGTYFGPQALHWAEANAALFWGGIAALVLIAILVQRVVAARARSKRRLPAA
jgi:uncharacterized membrane protein YdjX (TVP38/TMEM64 family)